MSSEPNGPLLPHGFLPVGLVLPSTVVPGLLASAKSRTYAGVFNRVGGNDDEYRAQSHVDSKHMSSSLLELQKALRVVIALIHPGWVPGVYSFMRSKAGGEGQEPHQDFQTSDLARARAEGPDFVPGSMVFALQPATKLRVYTGCFKDRIEANARVVDIPVGFCLLFRGDLIHCGMPYRKTNYRLHCYLTYEGMAWSPDIVQSVLPDHGECQHCGVKMLKGWKLRKHRYYCNKTPIAAANRLKRKNESVAGVYECEVCNTSYPLKSSLRTHRLQKHS